MFYQDENFYYDITEKEEYWKGEDMQQVIDSIAKSPNRKILEVGCGIADILRFLPKDIEYTGTDISELALERAQARHKDTNAKFSYASAEDLPFVDSAFDFVLMFNAIEHCRDPKKALNEIFRVLRPKGKLVLTGPNLDLPFSISHGIRHKNRWYKNYIRLLRTFDYAGRVFGFLKFRTIPMNFTEATGRYEKPDDDLRYFCSAYEVIEYLKRLGAEVTYINKLQGQGLKFKVKKLITHLPGMRYYGKALSVILIKS